MTTATTARRWEARDPDYQSTVRSAFEAQKAMAHIGATLETVEPGYLEIHLPIREEIMSHIPGIVHGGTIGMVADSAMGFCAMTVAEPNALGVTAEYKINMFAPAMGELVIARGHMVRPGKKMMVTRADVFCVNGGTEKHVATGLATLMALGPA